MHAQVAKDKVRDMKRPMKKRRRAKEVLSPKLTSAKRKTMIVANAESAMLELHKHHASMSNLESFSPEYVYIIIIFVGFDFPSFC